MPVALWVINACFCLMLFVTCGGTGTQLSRPWQHGLSGINLYDAVKLAVPESHTLVPKIMTLSCVLPELWQFNP